MITIGSFTEFEKYLGQDLGISDWHQITQQQINQFADATLDHQWIHLDKDRAEKETPFKSTIAHGYLTLSLIPYLWKQIVEIKNLKMEINYGIENLKFAQPVLAEDKVRLKANLTSIVNLRGTTKITMNAVLEIDGQKKPAYTAELVFLYHFEA